MKPSVSEIKRKTCSYSNEIELISFVVTYDGDESQKFTDLPFNKGITDEELQRWTREPTGFPVFNGHDDATCFSCERRLESPPRDSGYPPGNGQYVKTCACGLTTWYDVRQSL